MRHRRRRRHHVATRRSACNEKLRKILLDASRAKTAAQRLAALAGLRPGMLFSAAAAAQRRAAHRPVDGRALRADGREWEITREEQDELALESHRKLAKAYEGGFFTDLMTPFRGVNRDNNLRADLTIEKLRSAEAGLRPKVRRTRAR